MPESTYAALPDTVLAYKRSHQIGRFDPSSSSSSAAAHETQERKAQDMWKEVRERGMYPYFLSIFHLGFVVLHVYNLPSTPDPPRPYPPPFLIHRFQPKKKPTKPNQTKPLNKKTDIHPPLRCRLLPTTPLAKHGSISYVGPIPSLPGPPGAPWIGITLDEPLGRNDGSVVADGGTEERYFTCGRNRGVFVRAGRVEVGEGFGVLGVDDEGEGEGEGSEMEEI